MAQEWRTVATITAIISSLISLLTFWDGKAGGINMYSVKTTTFLFCILLLGCYGEKPKLDVSPVTTECSKFVESTVSPNRDGSGGISSGDGFKFFEKQKMPLRNANVKPTYYNYEF